MKRLIKNNKFDFTEFAHIFDIFECDKSVLCDILCKSEL